MRVNRLLILLLFVAFSTLSYSQRNSKFIDDNINKIRHYDSIIVWSADNKLRFEDFLGKPEIESEANANTMFDYLLLYSLEPPYSAYVVCVFDKKKSWLISNLSTYTTLNHEQGHFDIGEIFARKMNDSILKVVSVFNGKNIKNRITKIHNYYLHLGDSVQNRYDNETNHSIDIVKQNEWNQEISSFLSESNK